MDLLPNIVQLLIFGIEKNTYLNLFILISTILFWIYRSSYNNKSKVYDLTDKLSTTNSSKKVVQLKEDKSYLSLIPGKNCPSTGDIEVYFTPFGGNQCGAVCHNCRRFGREVMNQNGACTDCQC